MPTSKRSKKSKARAKRRRDRKKRTSLFTGLKKAAPALLTAALSLPTQVPPIKTKVSSSDQI